MMQTWMKVLVTMCGALLGLGCGPIEEPTPEFTPDVGDSEMKGETLSASLEAADCLTVFCDLKKELSEECKDPSLTPREKAACMTLQSYRRNNPAGCPSDAEPIEVESVCPYMRGRLDGLFARDCNASIALSLLSYYNRIQLACLGVNFSPQDIANQAQHDDDTVPGTVP